MLYDPASDLLRVLGEPFEGTALLRGSDLEILSASPAPSGHDVVRHDPARDRGVICSELAQPYLALAFEGTEALSLRPLAPASRYPTSRLAATWGCDWDGGSRVFVPVPNLGQLAVLDYESGDVLERRFVGFDVRAVAFDPRRERVYLAHYLTGAVVALDAAAYRESARWSVGRFVRDLVLSRDGRSLLVTSNLGLTRIQLD
jgi:hypothetical protein